MAQDTTPSQQIDSSSHEKEPFALRARRGAIMVGILAICVAIVALSGTGSVNLAIQSAGGATSGTEAIVSLYKGDVADELTDGDPANDPAPIDSRTITIDHQRANFNLRDFGAHTIAVTYADPNASYATPDPLVVSALWYDQRPTIWTP